MAAPQGIYHTGSKDYLGDKATMLLSRWTQKPKQKSSLSTWKEIWVIWSILDPSLILPIDPILILILILTIADKKIGQDLGLT